MARLREGGMEKERGEGEGDTEGDEERERERVKERGRERHMKGGGSRPGGG